MSLDNLPGLPQPSTLSSQSSRPSWTGDLPQCLCRWLPQVFLSQSTISIPSCELESPHQSWVNTWTSFPLPKGTLDFQLSWRPGTVSAQEQGKTAQELSLDIRDPPRVGPGPLPGPMQTYNPPLFIGPWPMPGSCLMTLPPTKWIE